MSGDAAVGAAMPAFLEALVSRIWVAFAPGMRCSAEEPQRILYTTRLAVRPASPCLSRVIVA